MLEELAIKETGGIVSTHSHLFRFSPSFQSVKHIKMRSLTPLLLLTLPTYTYGSITAHYKPVVPQVKGTPQILGLVADPRYNRDSCGSSDFGDRTFWTCRDTQLFYANGSVQISPVITSTASYTDKNADGTPVLHPLPAGVNALNGTVLRQYGTNSIKQAYFPVLGDECSPPSGACPNGSRFALWPDLPPMIAERHDDGSLVAYTWIRKSSINPDLSTNVANPATTLYRVDYHPGVGKNLPKVTVIDENFYDENEIPFGNYGNVVRNGIAYLYGQVNNTISLAKVPAASVQHKSSYLYYVNSRWTAQKPSIGDTGIAIANASAGGQGTYYYSEPWSSYVWIGGPQSPGSNVFITTAPKPEGPWIEPTQFYTGVDGDYLLGAYSIQAHPALVGSPQNNSVFITYTKNDLDNEGINVYTTPLVYVEWK